MPPQSCAAVPHASAAGEPPTCGAGAPSANAAPRSARCALAALDPGEAGDAAPGQRGQQRHRLVAGHGALAGQPPAGAGLRQPGQARGEQQRPLPVQAGVGGDDLADRLHAGPVTAVGQLAYVLVVVLVGLERSEEHTPELQSRQYLACRLLLEKKTNKSTPKPSDVTPPLQAPTR